jgi:LysR family cys regulon transcriptional activator
VRRGRLLRGYMYEFIRLFAPHLTRKLVDQALRARDAAGTQAVLGTVTLPGY